MRNIDSRWRFRCSKHKETMPAQTWHVSVTPLSAQPFPSLHHGPTCRQKHGPTVVASEMHAVVTDKRRCQLAPDCRLTEPDSFHHSLARGQGKCLSRQTGPPPSWRPPPLPPQLGSSSSRPACGTHNQRPMPMCIGHSTPAKLPPCSTHCVLFLLPSYPAQVCTCTSQAGCGSPS